MSSKRDRMSGNEAVALAIKQVNPDVMPAFPITPSTELPQIVSTYISNGDIDTEFRDDEVFSDLLCEFGKLDYKYVKLN